VSAPLTLCESNDTGRRLWLAAFLDPDLLPQLVEEAFGDLALLPLLELPVHRLPGREVDR
jgi:hypothetical protein